jgi:2-polyprenyl-6-methoxyphenol hydroxylase-like FAD-dependent oxidoreductase
MLPESTDVLIVGAGPAGLALAVTLQQAGVQHVIIDKLEYGLSTSRAAVIHAHTLETLDSIGVSARLAKAGLKVSTFSIRDHDRALLSIPFGGLQTQHPYLLMLPQDVTERVLAARLAELGGNIHRGVVATAFNPVEGGVEVTITSGEGERVIRARYVAGADGMHSAVRAAAGIQFEGAPYDHSFVLADVRMEWPLRAQEVSIFFSDSGLVVVAPLPDGSYRIVATLANAPERPGLDDIQAIIDARGPSKAAGRVTEVIWSSRFRVHHRLASAYRNDRLFVLGDAAHVHSPAGGQGMNCGLVDACVLGQLLADVLRGRRAAEELDSYEVLRRPAAQGVLALADRLTTMATMPGGLRRTARNAVLSTLNRIRPAKHILAQNLSGLSRKRRATLPTPATPRGAGGLPTARPGVAPRGPLLVNDKRIERIWRCEGLPSALRRMPDGSRQVFTGYIVSHLSGLP